MSTQTLAIIKPDAVERHLIGSVIQVIEQSGLVVSAMKMMHLTKIQASEFYKVHAERPFFEELTTFMSRSPVVVMVLSGDDAVQRYRTVMGATNPADADEGTIRQLFAQSVGENTVHGSDSAANAEQEIAFFFNADDIA